MLSVYDAGQKYPINEPTDFYITHIDGGLDTLSFTVPTSDPIYAHLAEENRVEYGDNDYIIKSIDAPGSSANIKCEINLDFMKESFYKSYSSGSVALPVLLAVILPSGWSVTGYNPGISRTISLENATNYDVVKQALKTYSVAFQWHTLTKTVVVINPADKTPSGEYLTDELNLRKISFKGESTDFVTRLYPYGKDGLTIASVNSGKEYIENHQYSDKIVSAAWSDERYTVPNDLKTDATEKLAELSAPARSYDCDVIDLAKQDSKYSNFAFAMYKVVTLIDRQRGLRLNHQIMEYKEYPHQPEKNVLTLASVVSTVQGNIATAQLAANAAQSTADEAKKAATDASVKVDQQAAQIELKVSKDSIIAAINISPEGITIDSSKLNITGFVTFSDLAGNGTTTINGANIKTGQISADRIDASTLTVKQLSDPNMTQKIYLDDSAKMVHVYGSMQITDNGTSFGTVGSDPSKGDLYVQHEAWIAEQILAGSMYSMGTVKADGDITSHGAIVPRSDGDYPISNIFVSASGRLEVVTSDGTYYITLTKA